MTKYILFIVLTLSLLCSSAQAQVDRAGIRNMARELIQDSNSDTSRQAWTNARINAYIDIAHLDMVKKTACLIGTTYYTLYTGTQTYNMPSDLLEVSRVSVWKSSNVYQALTRYTLEGLDSWLPTWQQNAAGIPERYYTWGNVIGLVPAANSAYSGANRLRVDYLIRPSTFTSDSDLPFNGYYHLYPYHYIIAYKVAALCKFRERAYGESTTFENQYLNMLRVMIDEINRKAGYFPKFQMDVTR